MSTALNIFAAYGVFCLVAGVAFSVFCWWCLNRDLDDDETGANDE